jgi:hypothetical protein
MPKQAFECRITGGKIGVLRWDYRGRRDGFVEVWIIRKFIG